MIQFLAGILGALALILPGISFSSMLYMMACMISSGELWAIGTLWPCCPSPGHDHRHPVPDQISGRGYDPVPHATYMIILGFVIGSIWDILKEMPAAPRGVEIPVCIALMAAGFLIIYLLSRTEDKYEKKQPVTANQEGKETYK